MTPAPLPQPATITVAEAAALLGISKSHAYRLVTDGAFPTPVIRMADRVLVCREPFERLLREGNSAKETAA